MQFACSAARNRGEWANSERSAIVFFTQGEPTMPVHSTTRCHEFGHPEISFEVAELVPPQLAQSFVSGLESMVAAGSVFRPGEKLQHGWSVVRFQSDGQGGLFLTEPDFSTRPIDFRAGVTETLVQNMRQVYTLDSYAVPRELLDFPTLETTAIICKNFATTKKIGMSRVATKGNDSGWFFGCYKKWGCNHQNASHLESVPLIEAVALRPEIANWLALPSGVSVILQPGKKPIVVRDDQELRLIAGSFVDQMTF